MTPPSTSATHDSIPQPGEWVTSRPPRVVEIPKRVASFPSLLLNHRDLVSTSVKRDLEVRFRGTILGWLWPLVHPLFLFTVYYFLFTKILSFKIPGEIPPGQESALAVYMFVGIMAWSAIGESLTRGTSAILDNGNLIKKLSFPSEILPLNVTLVGVISFLFAVIVFVLATVFTPMWPAPGIDLLWVPVLLFLQTVFTYGLVLLTSTLQVFLRDTQQFIGIIVTVWMFGTPLFWVPEAIPGIETYMPLIQANPVYSLVMAWRGSMMGDLTVTHDGIPRVIVDTASIGGHVAVFSVWAFASFLIGYAVFVLSQRRFADEV